MTEHPILFSGPLVRAILDGRKTQTRRLVRQPPDSGLVPWPCHYGRTGWAWGDDHACHCRPLRCPFGAPRDRLWVRETWRPLWGPDDQIVCNYALDQGEPGTCRVVSPPADWHYPDAAKRGFVPSIHMPRWASRLTLEVTDIRVERLQAITEEDARAEGAMPPEADRCGGGFGGGLHTSKISATETITCPRCGGTGYRRRAYRDAFADLWDSITPAASSWSTNPWVWGRRLQGAAMTLNQLRQTYHEMPRLLRSTPDRLYVTYRGHRIARLGLAVGAVVPETFARASMQALAHPTKRIVTPLLLGQPVALWWGAVPALVLVPV